MNEIPATTETKTWDVSDTKVPPVSVKKMVDFGM